MGSVGQDQSSNMKAFFCIALVSAASAAPQLLAGHVGHAVVGGQRSHQSVSKPFQGEVRTTSQAKSFGSPIASVASSDSVSNTAQLALLATLDRELLLEELPTVSLATDFPTELSATELPTELSDTDLPTVLLDTDSHTELLDTVLPTLLPTLSTLPLLSMLPLLFTLPLLSTLPPLTTPLSTLLPTPLPKCTPMRS